jgi:hypothetical protein
MNRATRTTASILGICGGLLGIEHGYFETLQGHTTPGSILISAFGPPCQPKLVWHGCEPAMTIIPDFFVTGILAIIISLIVILWAAAFVQKSRGGVILILLCIVQLLLGGGFVPPLWGIIAGFTATGINGRLTWWRARSSAAAQQLLAKLWPWSLSVFLIWTAGAWILGYLFNQLMMSLSCISFVVFDLVMPLLIVFAGLARDADTNRWPVPSFAVAKGQPE